MTRPGFVFGFVAVLSLALVIQSVRVDRLKADMSDARQQITALHEAREAAVADAEQQADECTARVAEARRATRAIQSLLTQEVAHDEAGCPDPRLLRGGELRATLQPGAPAPAEPLR